MNKKGILFSDIVMTSMFLGFVALAVIAVILVSSAYVEKSNEALAEQKSAYATTQLLRTFSQTPLYIEGEEANVAHYLNEYFSLSDSSKRDDLRRRTILRDGLRELAEKTTLPHLKFSKQEYTVLEASLWRYDREVDQIMLTTTWGNRQQKVQEENVIYIGFFQQDTNIQLPVYFPESKVPLGDEYILITITEKKS